MEEYHKEEMKKLLRPQDVLLLFLAGGLDAFFELKNLPMADACKNFYGWVPPKYRKTNYYQIVSHSLRVGYIDKVIKGGETYLRLTPGGRKKITREFSLSLWQKKKWDKKWRIIIFDIEEINRKTRDRLRRKLRELGFGMLQQSVWITPYDFIFDFREFIKFHGLGDSVLALETSSLLADDCRKLATKIWPIKRLNNKYQKIFQVLTKLHGRGEVSEEKVRRARSEYLEILREDPCLPRELLPDDWYRDKVETALKKLK